MMPLLSVSYSDGRLQTSREAGYLIFFSLFFFFSHILKDRNINHSWDAANFKPSKTYSARLKVSNNVSNIEILFENFTF